MKSFASLGRFLSALVKHDPPRAALLIVLLILTSLLQSVSLLLVLPLLEQVGVAFGSSEAGLGSGSLPFVFDRLAAAAALFPVQDPLAQILLFFAAVLLLRDGLNYWQSLVQAQFQQRFQAELRSSLYSRLISAPWTSISKLKSHEISYHLTTNITLIAQACVLSFVVATAAVLTLAYGAVALYAAPALVLILAPIGLLLLIPLRYLFRAAWITTAETLELHKDHEDRGQQFVSRFRQIANFGNQDIESLNQQQSADRIADHEVRIAKTRARARLLQSAVASLALIAIVWIALRVFSVAPQSLILLFLAAARLLPRLLQVQNQGQALLLLMPAYESQRRFIDSIDHAPRAQNNAPLAITSIELDGIQVPGRLNLPGTTPLVLSKGELVCLTAPTGAGKSTLCDVLSGIMPGMAQARINGAPLDEARLAAYRRAVTYLEQNSTIWQGTVREALAWAQPDASEQQMIALIDALGLAERILGHPDGLNAPLGDAGHWLSGGEYKRLALAQALLRNTPLLILDEFTANLDEETEAQIMALIARYKADRIIVCATHRPGPLQHADRILQLEGRAPAPQRLIDRAPAPVPIHEGQDRC